MGDLQLEKKPILSVTRDIVTLEPIGVTLLSASLEDTGIQNLESVFLTPRVSERDV